MITFPWPRRTLRLILKHLTRAVLRKHHPEVIAIVGSGPTSLIREALYTVFHEQYPTRRNLEPPETEFSVPLTIIGSQKYPTGASEWVILIIKTVLQLLLFRKYHHYLILEMSTNSEESFRYWLEVARPQLLVVSGQLPPNLAQALPPVRTVKEENTGLNDWDHYRQLTLKVAALYGIGEKWALQHLQSFNWPSSRLNIVNGRDGKIILDATYHYWPIPWTAVAEVAEGLPGKKVVILEENLRPKEGPQIKYPIITILQPEKIKDYAVIILRGPKFRFQDFLERLTE